MTLELWATFSYLAPVGATWLSINIFEVLDLFRKSSASVFLIASSQLDIASAFEEGLFRSPPRVGTVPEELSEEELDVAVQTFGREQSHHRL